MSTTQNLNQGFAAEVRAELARQDKSPAWLSQQTQINVNTLGRRLKGIPRFNITEMGSISLALGVPLSELLKRAENHIHGERNHAA